MKKKSIFQSIKEFFLKLFKVILSLFKKEEPNKQKELETFETNINNNKIKLRELDHSTLPDTQSTKASNDESSSVDTQDKTFKLYNKIKKEEVKDVVINVKYTYDEDRIIEIIDEILKEEYDIDVKRQKKTVEENIELLKEKLLEDVKEKIEEEEIQTEESLKEYLKEEIKKEIEEHPLDKKEPPKKYVMATVLPKKKIEPKKEVIPKIIKKDIIQEIPKVVKPKVQKKAKETSIAMVKTKEPAIIKPKDRLIVAASTATVIATKVAVDLIKPIEKKPVVVASKPSLKDKDRTKDLSPFKEIKEDLPTPDEKKTEEKKAPEIKAIKKDEKLNIRPIKKDDIKEETKTEEKKAPVVPVVTELKIEKEIQKEKEQTQEKIEAKIKEFEYVDDHKDQMKESELAQINSERLIKENEKIKDEIKQIEEKVNVLKLEEEEEEKAEEQVIVEEKKEIKAEEKTSEETKTEEKKPEEKKEEKKEEPKKEEPKKEEAPSPTFIDNIASTIDNSKIEMSSDKEFEDKEYEQYENEINDLLYDIEMYRLKYDKILTKEQKRKLREEERKLQAAKSNIQYQKAIDIETERKHLEEEIAPNELNGLELELKKQQLEHQKDLNDELLNNVEDLEFMTKDQVRTIEKKLIKKKLRKALVVTQMGSILALPFIRNKYFFYFTAGLIANTELMFLGDLFRRKTREYDQIDLGPIKNGRDALNGALELTRDNIIYLETLEKTTISKYPELSYDSEYLKYITALKSSLVKNHNKLLRKRDTLDKYIRKTNTKVKKLQQKEQQAA